MRWVVLAVFAGCIPDFGVPAAARIICTSNDVCRNGEVCVVDRGLCFATTTACISAGADKVYQTAAPGSTCRTAEDEAGLCRADGACVTPSCGDGRLDVDRGEVCDSGAANNDAVANACRSDCTAARCGDGVVDKGEACDIGVLNADGATCSPECTEGCGDGFVQPGEACDDGNMIEGDGCDTGCIASACGNGVRAPQEACDDGGNATGDGCSATCTVELGFACNFVGCFSTCGDGRITGTERCDDFDFMDGDGCSSCNVDPGYGCDGEPSVCSRIWYVDASAAGGDGKSWSTAFKKLEDAFSVVAADLMGFKEVWVADGHYVPATTFSPPTGITLVGGFLGTEKMRSERDPSRRGTILDGDRNGDDGPSFMNRSDNASAILTMNSVSNITINGFVVRGGHGSNGSGLNTNAANNVLFDQCYFTDNDAGPLRVYNAGTRTFRHTDFEGNAGNNGGVFYTASGATTVFEDCTFRNNTADNGGAIYNTSSNLRVDRCRFENNTATNGGGAYWTQSLNDDTFRDSLFIGNSANNGGAAFVWGASIDSAGNETDPRFINCTFSGNIAATNGPAVYASRQTPSPYTARQATPILVNSIVVNHTKTPALFISAAGNASYSVANSCIEDAFTGTSTANITSDPMLDATYHPQAGSPVLDVGDDTPLTVAFPYGAVDLDNMPRVVGTVDMGAFERQP